MPSSRELRSMFLLSAQDMDHTQGLQWGKYGVVPIRMLTQRVQVPNISELWSQIPFRVWYLGPESLNIGYLDPLGYDHLEKGPTMFDLDCS